MRYLLVILLLISSSSNAGKFQISISDYHYKVPKGIYFIKESDDVSDRVNVSYTNSYSLEPIIDGAVHVKISNTYDDTIIETLRVDKSAPIYVINNLSYKLSMGTISVHEGLYDTDNCFYNPSITPPQGVYNIDSDLSIISQYMGVKGELNYNLQSYYFKPSVTYGYLRQLSDKHANLFAFSQPTHYVNTSSDTAPSYTLRMEVGGVRWNSFVSYTSLHVKVTPNDILSSNDIQQILYTNPKAATFLAVGKYKLDLYRTGASIDTKYIGVGIEGYTLDVSLVTPPISSYSPTPSNSKGYYVYTRYYATDRLTPFAVYTQAGSKNMEFTNTDEYVGLKYIMDTPIETLLFIEFHRVKAPNWINPINTDYSNLNTRHYNKYFNMLALSISMRY